ncbi:MAG: hypothetical protein H6744_08935 [Deltaproteobacteria bacterium]|nr:hypothetical protein [Deltaproteobacteria bacterium]MCB9786804.1 hypothetical protein [Deltaproteobacteria bacterium]
MLGAPAVLLVTVEAPAEARLFVPANPAIEPFRVNGEPAPPVRTVEGGRATELHRFRVRPLRMGAKAIDPIEVVWRMPDGSSASVETQRLRVRIDGRLTNEDDPRLASAPPPVPVITTNWALIWTLSVLGAAALATLLTLIVLRVLRNRLRAAVPPPPPRPADEVALEKLAWLETADLPAIARYTRAVDVLREYLGGRFDVDALEATTRELLAALDAELTGVEHRQAVRAILEDADLVKFARLEPGDDEARALIPSVRTIVIGTWVAPEPTRPEPAVEAPVALAPASAAERVRAGLVDVGLALAIGALVVGACWAFGRVDQAWTGVLAMGLSLWLRDAFGPGSPGKALGGLRVVVRAPGQPSPRLGARLLRNALLLLPPIGLPVAALTLIYHPLRHRLGDVWARTEVVRGGRP